MKTKLYDVRSIPDEKLSLNDFSEPAAVLAGGGTVAFPTETVYGLGADAANPSAVKKIFEAKGRPSDNPLIVHICPGFPLNRIVREVPETADRLAERFWPGPLSMIMKRDPSIPDCVTAGLDTVAVRMPVNPEARLLIEAAGCPVAAPSANLSGKPSPTRPDHVVHDLDGRVDAVILGRDCEVGIESTVIDLTASPPVILRPGIITKEAIESVIGPVLLAGRKEKTEVPKAPGMKYTHYAPDAPLTVFEGSGRTYFEEILKAAREAACEGKKTAVLSTDEGLETLSVLRAEHPDLIRIFCLGSKKAPETIAHNLFDLLRRCDTEGFDLILAEGPEDSGIGFSVMNRMDKAAVRTITIE